MLNVRRTLLLGAFSSLIVTGCGSSSTGTSSGTVSAVGSAGTDGGASGGTKGGGSNFTGPGGISGTNDSVIATPSLPGTVSVVTGASQTIDVIFSSSDARTITGFAVTGSLGTMPAGWSGPSTFVCASVTTDNGCVLTLNFAATAAGTGTLTLNYEFVDNASLPSTSHSLSIPYAATTHNNVLAAASPTGQINAVAGAGSQAVSVNFTTDDGNAATNLVLLTDLTALPAGWSSTATSLPCAIVSTGSGCELTLVYTPPAADSGPLTLTLAYGYTDGIGAARTGSLNIPYYATAHDNVAAVASPAGQINAIQKTGGQAVKVAFTTDDGKPASNLFVTSDLKTLPSGWTSTASSFSCASVSAGNGCMLPLTYAPTALGSGTFTLTYIYDDDSGAAKGGLLNVAYAATTNDNVVGTAAPAGPVAAIVGEVSPSLLVTFTTDDARQATALQLTTNLVSGLPPGWSSTAASLACTVVSSGNDCQLPLTYTPMAPASGILMLNYSYLNNDNLQRTGTVDVQYHATSHNTVAGTPSAPSLDVVTGAAPTPVTVTFTTSDTYPAYNLSVNLTALPAGWTAASSGMCATVSAGTPCLLSLTYAPMVPTTGTPELVLPFTYSDNSGTPNTGAVNIAYTATSNNTVSGTPSPSSPLNVVTGSSATVAVTFITNDGYPASNLSVNLAGLPAGWSATSSGTCATVSSGTTCLLNLSYMPTVPTTGAPTLELPFTYTNNSGTVENGTTFAVTYTAVAP